MEAVGTAEHCCIRIPGRAFVECLWSGDLHAALPPPCNTCLLGKVPVQAGTQTFSCSSQLLVPLLLHAAVSPECAVPPTVVVTQCSPAPRSLVQFCRVLPPELLYIGRLSFDGVQLAMNACTPLVRSMLAGGSPPCIKKPSLFLCSTGFCAPSPLQSFLVKEGKESQNCATPQVDGIYPATSLASLISSCNLN